MNNGYIDMWNNWSKKRRGIPVYDKWLDNYKDVLDKYREYKILDLGCGLGANSLYLNELGYKVVAADFAKSALDNIKENIFDVETLELNMMDKFPIDDNSYYVVVADLSLHYFDAKTTSHIMREIKRILKVGGVLLARVARVDDTNFGALEGEELEHHYYFEGAYTKRFFDEDDVLKFFSIIGEVNYNKAEMVRDEEEYSKVKRLFEIKATKKDFEYIDVVDEDGNLTGEVLDRKTVHDRNLLHNEIGVFVVNYNKEVLLQKRSRNKRYSPLKWGIVGGHVSSGEGIVDAALRELQEEVGITVSKEELILLPGKELFTDETNSHFTYFYYVIKNLNVNECTYQVEEVEDVKWFDIDEVIKIVNSEDNYTTLNDYRVKILEKLKCELEKH